MAPIGVPQHAQVSIANPIGAGFGIVGNLVESRRAAGAGQELEKLLTKVSYDLRASLQRSVTVAVRKAGFTVVPATSDRPDSDRARFLRQYPSDTHADAYLDVYATYLGFEAPQSSTDYRPRIEIATRIVSARTHQTLFQAHIVYGAAATTDDDAVLVRSDDGAHFRDRTALSAHPATTARALQSAIDAVGWELTKRLM